MTGLLADLRLGLTGHGHDDMLGLIDLKGRIYDPVLKRVLTPDPLVSMPLFGQSYNRYSYVLNDPVNLVDPTGYQAGFGPDCGSCQLWVGPPVEGGGIQIGSGDAPQGAVPQKIDWEEFQSLPLPPLQSSRIDGSQSTAAVPLPYHGGFLGGLVYERQRAERLRYEADQMAMLRGAVLGAGAALVIWSGGTALLAIEELSVLGGAIGMTATQAAAAGALRTTTVVVPLLLGEYSIVEGLRQNDPGKITEGLMLAMSGGATFGTGLGAGPRAGGTLAGAANGVSGRWVQVSESMSERAAAYQARFGQTGQAFHVNGVRFDGIVNGVLLEAKEPGYANFVRNGAFQPWFRGADALVSQAQRQMAAARGAPIQWHFAEEAAANATRALLNKEGITGIQVLFTP